MHTGIVLAIEADDNEEAVQKIEFFNEHNASWSDWNEHGGRWEDDLPNAVLRYTDNPTLFMEKLREFQKFTQDSKERYLKELGDVTIKELVTGEEYLPFYKRPAQSIKEMTQSERDEYFDKSLALFRAKRLLELQDGDFGCDQHFYDAESHTPNDNYLLERIEKNPESQFLVVWDYHY
jgi:hypothetical protein